MCEIGIKQQKIDPKMGRFFVIGLAVPTGLGFATRNYLALGDLDYFP
jgi:hypothetical protein